MNERIRELAEQATTRTFDGTGTDVGELVLDEQKFAELIVRECIEIITERCDDLCYGNAMADEKVVALITWGDRHHRPVYHTADDYYLEGIAEHLVDCLKNHLASEE